MWPTLQAVHSWTAHDGQLSICGCMWAATSRGCLEAGPSISFRCACRELLLGARGDNLHRCSADGHAAVQMRAWPVVMRTLHGFVD